MPKDQLHKKIKGYDLQSRSICVNHEWNHKDFSKREFHYLRSRGLT